MISTASNAKKEYFKLLVVVGEQRFPQLQMLKNYEYFDRSFLKVPNMVKNNFARLEYEKTTNILIVASGRSSTWSENHNFPELFQYRTLPKKRGKITMDDVIARSLEE